MTDEPTSESSPEGTLPPPAAEPPTTAETPTTPVESVPVDEPTEAAPVTTTTTATTEPPRRKGVLVPVWALVTVAGLLLIVASGLVGYAIGSHDDGAGRTVRAGGFQLPQRLVPPGFGQFGNGPNGNGNNGNGSNGNGNGTTTATAGRRPTTVHSSAWPCRTPPTRVGPSSCVSSPAVPPRTRD